MSWESFVTMIRYLVTMVLPNVSAEMCERETVTLPNYSQRFCVDCDVIQVRQQIRRVTHWMLGPDTVDKQEVTCVIGLLR